MEHSKRITRIELYLSIAQLMALRSTCLRKKVGAVITYNNRIISTGYNGTIGNLPHCTTDTCNESSPCTDTVHAEANAIAFSARLGISLKGSILFVTCAPCFNCAKLIVQAGIIEVVYIEEYRDKTGLSILERAGVHTYQASL